MVVKLVLKARALMCVDESGEAYVNQVAEKAVLIDILAQCHNTYLAA